MPKLFERDENSFNANVGELWEVAKGWETLFLDVEERSFILIRRVGNTSTWDALCVETGTLITLPLSSVLYERVV